MPDKFSNHAPSLQSPAAHLFEVTPDDANDLSVVSRALNVGGSGSVRVTTVEGDTATVFIAAGGAFPLRVRRIFTTGTTASSIVVMY